MILDLKKLKRSGKEQSDFYFEYEPNEELIDIPSVNFDGAVKITGTITLTGEHSAYLEGEAVFNLKGECTRCLEQTEKNFVAEFAESVDANDEDGYPEGYQGFIEHHGILGMKWGVRRYQNKDGSLTAAGKKHRAAEEAKLKERERNIKGREKRMAERAFSHPKETESEPDKKALKK